jgi:hypothetical protein
MLAGGLWALLWGLVALMASAFGNDAGLLGWVLIIGAIALGGLVFAYGASLMTRRGAAGVPRPERPPQTPARREW